MILQACPQCARQYDVRHLAPGERVRCACDADFTVEHRGELRVVARKCGNCGGQVTSDAPNCGYCRALLDPVELASTICPACFARIGETARHCSGCGVELLAQALPPIPAGRDCPRCGPRPGADSGRAGDGAARERTLRIRSLERLSLVECGACGGLWLDPEAFADVCRDAEARQDARLFESTDQAMDAGLDQNLTVAYIPCLDCGELMQRRQYRHRGRSTGVVVDVCRKHGIWLDANELERVVAAIRASGAVARTGGAESGGDPFAEALAQVDPRMLLELDRARNDSKMRHGSPGAAILEAVLEVFAHIFLN